MQENGYQQVSWYKNDNPRWYQFPSMWIKQKVETDICTVKIYELHCSRSIPNSSEVVFEVAFLVGAMQKHLCLSDQMIIFAC